MPSYKRTHIQQNRNPECKNKALLVSFVAQQLLGQQCARPTSRQGQKMKRVFCGSPSAGHRCRLVKCIREHRDNAQSKVCEKYRQRQTPANGHGCVNGCEHRECQDAHRRPWRWRFNAASPASPCARWILHCPSLLLAVASRFDFKAKHLPDGWPARTRGKRFDVNENFLATFGGLDKTEAPLVVPGFKSSSESHAAYVFKVANVS